MIDTFVLAAPAPVDGGFGVRACGAGWAPAGGGAMPVGVRLRPAAVPADLVTGLVTGAVTGAVTGLVTGFGSLAATGSTSGAQRVTPNHPSIPLGIHPPGRPRS